MPVQTRTHPGEGHQAHHWAELASQGGLSGSRWPRAGALVTGVQPLQALCASGSGGAAGSLEGAPSLQALPASGQPSSPGQLRVEGPRLAAVTLLQERSTVDFWDRRGRSRK